MDMYALSRTFWDYSFENPDKIKPTHIALYFFTIEHCNRLGWKEKFGLPTTMVMEAIGVKSYNTYIGVLNDLVSFGFLKLIEKSKNQYSSNVIAISKNNKANNKALDKAIIKHTTKQHKSMEQSTSESKEQSIDSIDIPDTIIPSTNKPIYNTEVDMIYYLYPSECYVKGTPTGKGSKNKEKIRSLIKQNGYEWLRLRVESYLASCKQNKVYLKNFATFLNNIPEPIEVKSQFKPYVPNFQSYEDFK